MPITLVNPLSETLPQAGVAAPRLADLKGKRIALLDISKPGGNIFLDRIERLLKERGVTSVIREMKPTFAKPAPLDVIEKIRSADAVIEALAD
jgi:dihydroorotate dehydrogenase